MCFYGIILLLNNMLYLLQLFTILFTIYYPQYYLQYIICNIIYNIIYKYLLFLFFKLKEALTDIFKINAIL